MATNLPVRSATMNTSEDVIADEDTSEVTKLFHERLQAWKHACGYLEDYVSSTEKMQVAHGKEYEKVLKTVSNPLKEGNHFSTDLGGITGMFDNIRSNTQAISNQHTETAKNLKGTVLPVFERLHAEIKAKQKEHSKGINKSSKSVDKARAATQKHIELLGSNTSAFGSSTPSSKADPNADPFVLQKGVYHRLNRQIQEENAARQDMLTVQANFSQFEEHIVQVFQQGLGAFNQALSLQLDRSHAQYADMTTTTQQINPRFEWNAFVQSKSDVLIDPHAPPRSLETVGFANQDHRSTQALIQGGLERKSGLLKRFDAGFYSITPAMFLHEFKTDDNLAKDPTPETSLYLPDCTVGGLNGALFNIKGKDASGSKVANAMSRASEYEFRASSNADAERWYSVIESIVGNRASSAVTSPVSPASSEKRNFSGLTPGSETGASRNVSAGSGYGNLGAPQESGVVHPTGTMPAGADSGVPGQPGQY